MSKVESRTPETPYELTDNERRIQNVYCWLRDRAANCRRLAESKTGSDRAGWLEDAVYFDDAMSLILLAASRPSVPQQGQGELFIAIQKVLDRIELEHSPAWAKKGTHEFPHVTELRRLGFILRDVLAASRSEEATPPQDCDQLIGERDEAELKSSGSVIARQANFRRAGKGEDNG